MRRTLLLLVASLGVSSAQAAERSRTPPMLRGDFSFGYVGGLDSGQLRDRRRGTDNWTEAGRSLRQRHGLRLGGIFSVYHGLAVVVDLPITIHDRTGWSDVHELRYDPRVQRPTAVGTSLVPAEILDSSAASRLYRGPGDLRVGLRGLVFAQEGLPHREAPANLALEINLSLPTGGNHDLVRDDLSAGPGAGGLGLSFAMTFSRRVTTLEPYAGIEVTLRAPYRALLYDSAGVLWMPDDPGSINRTRLKPSDRVTALVGSEIELASDRGHDARSYLDLHAALHYDGPDEISSGRRLPAPMDATIGAVAVTAEHVTVELGIAARVRTRSAVELWVDFNGGWVSPHTVELLGPDAYRVQTGNDSFVLRWGLGARLRFR